MPKPARSGYGESGPGRTHLLLGGQRHSLLPPRCRHPKQHHVPHALFHQSHHGQPTAGGRSLARPLQSFRPADQDLQIRWEGAVRCTFLPKLEIFTAVFHRHARDRANRSCDRARIAAANTRDSRGPQAQCPEAPDSQRSLTVHARTAATWVTAIRARRPSARLRRQRTRSNQEWRRPLCALRSAARPSFASSTTRPQCRRHGRRGEAT
jgi:hypothetical protein